MIAPPSKEGTAIKVTVDPDKCEGNRRCATAAPQVFEVRVDDLSHVLLDDVPASLREAVERAIRLCPRQAISWVEST
jgi:ferredoxin